MSKRQLFTDALKLCCRCAEDSVFLQSFLKLLVEKEGYSKIDYLGIRMNLFHRELNMPEDVATYFLSVNHMGKKKSLNNPA